MGKGMIDALDDAEYSANVITLVKNGVDFMRKHNHVMWDKPGLTRIEMPDYPLEAMTEALTNAIIHRDYSVIGSEVHIDIYDDRIEITSPGGMYDSKPIQDLNLSEVPSTRRNPVIADLFQRLDYAERRGSGIRKILNGYEGKDRQPRFFSTESWFKTTLYNLNYGIDAALYDTDGKNVTDIGGDGGKVGGISGGDGGNQAVIIKLILDEPTITIAAISKQAGVPLRTVERIMSNLRNDGRIKRVGSSRSGRWKIIENGDGGDE